MTIEFERIELDRGQDLQLAREARNGSRAAFDVLFDRHKLFVYNVCYRMLGSRDDAKDATQSAFLNAFRGLHTFREGSAFRSWLYRIAINISTQMLNQRRRRRMLALQFQPQVEPEASGDTVWEAILTLPTQLRAVLVLFYFQGLSTEEIAEVLGCSSGAVRTRLHRARTAFKKRYEELAI